MEAEHVCLAIIILSRLSHPHDYRRGPDEWLSVGRVGALVPVQQNMRRRNKGKYWPLIGQYSSRDLNTGLSLVTTGHVTWTLASHWSTLVTWQRSGYQQGCAIFRQVICNNVLFSVDSHPGEAAWSGHVWWWRQCERRVRRAGGQRSISGHVTIPLPVCRFVPWRMTTPRWSWCWAVRRLGRTGRTNTPPPSRSLDQTVNLTYLWIYWIWFPLVEHRTQGTLPSASLLC